MKCSFCGHVFDEPMEICANCKAICCPNCGYEIERESRLAKLAKKLFEKLGRSSQRMV